MGVFDRRIVTRLAVKDPLKDHTLPHPAALAWHGINGPDALASTHGQHCELVHGDHWDETSKTFTDNIHRDETTTITRNHEHTIKRDQQVTISGHHKETFASRCNQSILGPHVIFNGTVRNELRLGAYTEVYGKTEWHDDQDGDIVVGVDHYERFDSATLTHTLDVQDFGMALSLVGLSFGLYGAAINLMLLLDYTFAGVHGEVTLLHMEAHPHHTEDHDGPPGLPAPP